ncbi:uncharacterized protein EDB93DRAFT_127699 [Suillus bovinus]|uniref:uncharacterized protein n=1 Tax=Suillus bovinus TaxID=48563 RepID=UPI001B886F69|nr:uncharacterized protein EDB93DRAFT_127699 [Suillus bovinus]KAG2154978.1 hypothetical protein EDB93DRAFT_127699 [Suillus bovinus]
MLRDCGQHFHVPFSSGCFRTRQSKLFEHYSQPDVGEETSLTLMTGRLSYRLPFKLQVVTFSCETWHSDDLRSSCHFGDRLAIDWSRVYFGDGDVFTPDFVNGHVQLSRSVRVSGRHVTYTRKAAVYCFHGLDKGRWLLELQVSFAPRASRHGHRSRFISTRLCTHRTIRHNDEC